MVYLLSASMETMTFSSGSPISAIPVGDPARRSNLLLRAENDGIWIGAYNSMSDFPASEAFAFRLLNGEEYRFTFEPAQYGDEDPGLYVATTSGTPVTLSYVVTYEGV